MVQPAEVERIPDNSLIQLEFRARNNQRYVYGGVGAHVGIAKFELVDPCGSIVIRVRVGKLRAGLAWDVMNGHCSASEEQPFVHGRKPDPAVRFASHTLRGCTE